MKNSGIAWTDHTFNPWVGCQEVSPACDNCYAREHSHRFRTAGSLPLWGALSGPLAGAATRRPASERTWAQVPKWNAEAARAGKPALVFSASLADVFEFASPGRSDGDNVMIAGRHRLFALIEATPWLVWLLLTKRPKQIMTSIPEHWRGGLPRNVWVGTTVEDPTRLDRLEALREVPAIRRFVSYEPAIAAVDFTAAMEWLDWVIVGGESGRSARPFAVEWARHVVQAAAASNHAVPFVKQLGAHPTLDGFPLPLRDTWAGAEPLEWPEDIRVQRTPPVWVPGVEG